MRGKCAVSSKPASVSPKPGGGTAEPAATRADAAAEPAAIAVNASAGPAAARVPADDRKGRSTSGLRAVIRTARPRAIAVARFARGAPVTAALIAALWVVAAVTGSLIGGPGASLTDRFGFGAAQLAAGRWWTPVTAMFFSSGLPGYVAVTVLLVAACAPMERQIGSGRAAVVVASSQVIGVLIAGGLIAFGARVGDVWAGHLHGSVDVGIAPAVIGVVIGGSRSLSPLWRRRLRVVVAAVLVVGLLYVGGAADVTSVAAALVGAAVGAVVVRAHPRARQPHPRADRRALVALIVAAAAIGPIASLGAAHRFGPLSALDFLFVPALTPADVTRWCVATTSSDGARCAETSTAFLVQGIGPLIQTLLPALVLLVLAEGLRRGRRAALIGTVVVNVGLAVIGAFLSREELADLISAPTGAVVGGAQVWVVRLAPIVLPLAIATLVVVYRAEFPILMPRAARRRWLVLTLAVAAAVIVATVVVGWLVRDQFDPAPTLRQLLQSVPGRFAPSGYVGGADPFFPVGDVAVALYRWSGTTFWAVVLIATGVSFWQVRGADENPDRSAAAALVRQDSGPGTMAYMALWRGNHYFFTADRSTLVAYRVIAGVAVTTGDPIGPHPASAMEQFVAYCAAAGWTPAFFSVTERTATIARAEGYRTLKVASDAVLDPRGLSFAGKPWQHLRAAFHRADRLGVTARWALFDDLPRETRDQIARIDRQWLAGKHLPEMGFTLGGLAELADRNVRLLLAVDSDGRVLAVTSWLPGYRDGAVVGWTVDFMRRDPDAFTGAMEFVIGTALTTFGEEGAEYVSLSGVPLAWPDGAAPGGVVGRALDALSGIMEPVYGFRSLFRFKSKFSPTFVPLYLVYTDVSALPTVTNAVLHAYVPHVGPGELTHLLRRLVAAPARRPAPHVPVSHRP